LFQPVTKRTVSVGVPGRIPQYVHEAFRTSNSGRRGPVVVNIPGDMLGQQIDAVIESPTQTPVGPAPDARSLGAAVELLNGAERPVVFAGAGVKWARASEALAALAERLGAPIVASAGNGDVVPNDHPLYIGQVGPRGNVAATATACEADVILAIGTRLGYNTTLFKYDNLSADAKIIHVDIEPTAVGRYFPVEVGIAADAGSTLVGLLELVSPKADAGGWADQARARRSEVLAERAAVAGDVGDDGFVPLAAYAAIQAALPRDAIVTVDTGTISLSATDALQTYSPPALLTPLDFGLVGFSYPAGLGAKAAAPTRPVVSVIGDGGFGMAMIELGTAVASGLSTVTVVMNNGCWGAEKAYQRDFFGERYLGADLVNPPFDEVARGFGAQGIRVESAEELTEAVADSISSDRPTVIEVPVDPSTISSFRRDSFPHRATA
jgi:acetolactate synthase-1/2/3 large subunit/sulfoacetaldehyde acetyltransferase